jgi:hypothetical protein
MSLHGAFASMHSHGGPPPSRSAVPIRRPPVPLPLHRLHERGGRRVPLRRFAQIALDDPGPRMVIRSAEPYGAMLGRGKRLLLVLYLVQYRRTINQSLVPPDDGPYQSPCE